jgi:biopolymer transport protein ExbD
MAETSRYLDVWIIETNTVYREVPFTGVVDWIQQGRLLEDDMLRWSGQAEWFRVDSKPAFAAYLPRPDPKRAEDQAEAMEPVEVEIAWRHRPEDEDDDVDMVPLIDVTLVLLIFFIMTSSAAVAEFFIDTPAATFGLSTSDPTLLWIGIERDKGGNPVYALGIGQTPPTAEDQNFKSLEELLRRLDEKLNAATGPVEVNIRGDRNFPVSVIDRLSVQLEKPQRRQKISKIYNGVSEKK